MIEHEEVLELVEHGENLNMIRKAGFEKVKVVSKFSYDIVISEELRANISSVQVDAHKACEFK